MDVNSGSLFNWYWEL